MKYRYYSQNGEDYILWKLFKFKKNGFYVDVGAFEGVHLSNSYSFEKMGWSGICIEPHPKFFKLLQEARPGSICLNYACVGNNNIETAEFFVEELGLLSGISGNREKDVQERYENRGLEFKGFEKIRVLAATLNRLLDKHLPKNTEIDFISTDVEGTEIEVLEGLDLIRYRPRVLTIEANSEDMRQKINSYMDKFGYTEARKLGMNYFYARDKKDIRTLRSLVVDCKLEETMHPLGERFTCKPSLPSSIKRDNKRLKGILQRFKRVLAEQLYHRFVNY